MQSSPAAQKMAFIDRSPWLTIVGLVEVLMGGFCVLFGLSLALFSRFFRAIPAAADLMRGGMLISNVLMFGALALMFVWLGIGTMRARRWARDMTLMTAWLWLIVGTLALVILYWVMPRLLSDMAAPGQAPLGGAEIAAAMVLSTIVLGVPYVILPGVLVLFYSGKNVRRTFEARDPAAGWTSKCPFSVLTASQLVAGVALTLLATPIYTDAIPFFGRAITGIMARLIIILAGLLSAWLAWAIYKLKPLAWWVALFFTMASLGWFLGSYAKQVPAEISPGEKPPLDLGSRILSTDILGANALFVSIGILAAVWLVFLLLIMKHFKAPPGTGNPA